MGTFATMTSQRDSFVTPVVLDQNEDYFVSYGIVDMQTPCCNCEYAYPSLSLLQVNHLKKSRQTRPGLPQVCKRDGRRERGGLTVVFRPPTCNPGCVPLPTNSQTQFSSKLQYMHIIWETLG